MENQAHTKTTFFKSSEMGLKAGFSLISILGIVVLLIIS